MELPEYHNADQVRAAVKKQTGIIAAKRAEVDAERAVLAAIRKMCPHEYTSRSACGRDAGRQCDICGDSIG